MADESRAAARLAPDAGAGEEATTKEALQERVEEARDSITQTVTDIKDKVVEQYESVKETVADTLDWREQFRAHPAAWCFGALAVGYVVGSGVAEALREGKGRDELLAQLAAVGDRFSDELTQRGMSILAPALTGTVLVPVLASKVNDLLGIDISGLTDLLTKPSGARAADGPKKTKKGGGKKGGKKNGKKGKKNKKSSAS